MGSHKINRFIDTECIVVGASLAAISAALEGARRGNRTALVMHTNSPALEIGTSMGAWLTESEAELMPENLRDALLTNAGGPTAGGTEPFRLLDQTIALTRIEDLLIDAGISIFYGARPIGLLANDVDETTNAVGVLFGGKFGTAAATGGLVIDCTAHASLVHSAGGGTWIGSDDESEYSLIL
ncbi:MAG: FAD-dependent oxidoreductase, partial [Spirochaetales bacterium]|nr:FAD-dependent oxidoreductase [Spirochaetales bacterium]